MRSTDLPTVLFVDDAFPSEPFAAALSGRALTRVDAAPGPWSADPSVRAVVTGAQPVRAADVARLPGLELVLTCSIGTDHLDVPGLAARGLAVCHTPTYCTDEVADHALAGVLALLRGFPGLAADVRAGGWDWAATGMLRRFDHSCLGLVGLGRIGRSVAVKAVALGMEVIAVDPAIPAELVPPGVALVPLAELLARADAISLHAPPTPGDRPLLDAAAFAAMRPRTVLVNTARTALVDLDAMTAALDDGRLAGAMFDVWESEPPRADDRRWQRPELLLTPHAGWASDAADAAYVEEGLSALRAVLDGAEPPNRIA
ncbi:NAD(P)-dependent oxidoreductase [Patulibacter defluvii]|uniref:NAD(P)-dependent oxidoreductase n=1 Tax=Patulibacter defluvii TaxID=3095358 RepID=UPI002A7481D4|nr:NAD(P)-dependent oxidoreductase [Patulibacter sp. DM4]